VKEIIRRLGDSVLYKAYQLEEKVRKGKETEGVLDTHFLQAVKDDAIPLMEIFLKLGANIEARDAASKYKGGTALHIASSKGAPKVAEFLLKKGAAIHSRTGTHPCDFGAVHFAARGGHQDVLSILLDNGADIDMKCNPNGCKDWTALHLAARNGRTPVVELLIKRGANTNAPAEEDRLGVGTFSPAFLAVYYGHLREAKLLFDAGARIEGSEQELYPLHGATKNNQYEMVKFLLKRGANINSNDTSKQTALHLASALGYFDIVKLLLNFQYEEHLDEFTGANIDEQVKKLPDINFEDKRGNTPLHEAAVNNHREIALYLLASGANPKAKNSAGKTPVEEALRNNRKELADDIIHEVKKLKALRIQQQKPLLLRIARQEAQLTGQAGLIYKQEEEFKKQAAEIDQLKKQIAELFTLLRK
jgi:ankyrin repeat protein